MGIRGDEGDGCRVAGASVIPTIPHHLPISLLYNYIKMEILPRKQNSDG
jgi:hypothetical protein